MLLLTVFFIDMKIITLILVRLCLDNLYMDERSIVNFVSHTVSDCTEFNPQWLLYNFVPVPH